MWHPYQICLEGQKYSQQIESQAFELPLLQSFYPHADQHWKRRQERC